MICNIGVGKKGVVANGEGGGSSGDIILLLHCDGNLNDSSSYAQAVTGTYHAGRTRSGNATHGWVQYVVVDFSVPTVPCPSVCTLEFFFREENGYYSDAEIAFAGLNLRLGGVLPGNNFIGSQTGTSNVNLPSAPANATWVAVKVTKNGNTVKVYFDGVLQTTATITATTTLGFSFTCYNGCSIDEIKLTSGAIL